MEQDEEPLTPQAWHPPQEGLPEGDERVRREQAPGRVCMWAWACVGGEEQTGRRMCIRI